MVKEVKSKQPQAAAAAPKEKRAERVIEKKPEPQAAAPVAAKDTKKVEKQRIKKKIEDFNKFTKLKAIKEAKKKKELLEVVSLDQQLVQKAIQALVDFQKQQKQASKSLVEDEDEFIYVEVTLSKLPEAYSIRPFPIKLPESIYSSEYFTKCAVIVKDPAETFRQKVESMEIPCIGKVIGYTELVKEYNRFEEKRKLCKEFDLFFCDYKIYDLMRKPLGKVFYDRKKFPFPIDCDSVPAYSGCGTFEEYLNSLTKNTSYFMQGNGPNYTMRVARSTMSVASSVKNVLSGVPNLIAHILQAGELEPSAVRRICLKTASSPSLPVATYVSEREKGLLRQAVKEAQKSV